MHSHQTTNRINQRLRFRIGRAVDFGGAEMALKGADDGLRLRPVNPVSGNLIAEGGERFLQRRDGFVFTAQSERRHIFYRHIVRP